MLSKPNYKENGIHFSGCNDDGALFPPPPPRAITHTAPNEIDHVQQGNNLRGSAQNVSAV